MTLLASVNRLRQLQRDEGISATSAAQLDHQTAIGLLNDAASDILNSHRWSFLRRYDGFAFFPGQFTATTGGLTVNNSTFVLLNSGAANSWDATLATQFSTNVRSKIRFTNSAEYPNTSFVLTNLEVTAHFPGTLSTAYQGVAINSTGAIEVYTHEFILPSTVRQVLDVFDQEEDIQVVFVDRDLDGTPMRPTDYFGESVYEVSVGGSAAGTTLSGATATTGEVLSIWPPPSSDLYLQYSSIYRYADLAADTDDWTGVPVEVVKLIQNVAFEKSLASNVEQNDDMASRWFARNQAMLDRLLAQDLRAPSMRQITPEIGMSRSRSVSDPYTRWASRTVPSP